MPKTTPRQQCQSRDDTYVDPVPPSALRRAANLLSTSGIPFDIMPECSAPLDPSDLALATDAVVQSMKSNPRQARALTLRVLALNMTTCLEGPLRTLLDDPDGADLPDAVKDAVYLAAAQAPLRTSESDIACFNTGDILPLLRQRMH